MNFVNIHPIGYEERGHSHHPDLFAAMDPYLEAAGHKLLPPTHIHEADIVVFDSAVWQLEDGSYSPYDWNKLRYVFQNRLPIVFMDNFDHRGWPGFEAPWPGKDNWQPAREIAETQDWARFIVQAADWDIPIIYFMRKMQLSQEYPEWVYPVEYPLFNDYPLATREEFDARPYDICFLGEASFPRLNALVGLYADGRMRIDGHRVRSDRRTGFEEWVDRHRQARLFLEADCSMGSERPQRLMTVAGMLRLKSDHRLPFPRQDGIHQVEFGDYEGNVSRADCDKIVNILNDRELCYRIYTEGAQHMRDFYSMEARCNYIIQKIERYLETLPAAGTV